MQKEEKLPFERQMPYDDSNIKILTLKAKKNSVKGDVSVMESVSPIKISERKDSSIV